MKNIFSIRGKFNAVEINIKSLILLIYLKVLIYNFYIIKSCQSRHLSKRQPKDYFGVV